MLCKPYVDMGDVVRVCPFVSQLQTGSDDFYAQRNHARVWLDNAIRAHHAGFSDDTCEVVVDARVKHACAYKAASEILAQQITPNMDNAYAEMAARFQRIAEQELTTLIVKIYVFNQRHELTLNLNVSPRGRYG